MQRFSSFFSPPKPPFIPRAEHKPLIHRSGTEATDKPLPSSRNEANRRNARFLEEALNIQDQRVLAQATQALESTLNAPFSWYFRPSALRSPVACSSVRLPVTVPSTFRIPETGTSNSLPISSIRGESACSVRLD